MPSDVRWRVGNVSCFYIKFVDACCAFLEYVSLFVSLFCCLFVSHSLMFPDTLPLCCLHTSQGLVVFRDVV